MGNATRGRIIAFRADRLGARLVSLMNAMRIADVTGPGSIRLTEIGAPRNSMRRLSAQPSSACLVDT